MISRFIISFFFLLYSCLFYSQKNLSVIDVINFAIANNHNIQNAKTLTSIDSIKNTWAGTGIFPSVDFLIGNNNFIQDNTSNPFTFTPGVILSQSISPSINSSWNLGPANFYSKKHLEHTFVSHNPHFH